MLQPWYVRSRPLQGRTGSFIFAALYGQPAQNRDQNASSNQWQTIATLLESPYPLPANIPQARLARYSLCAGPPRYHGDHPSLWTPPIGKIL
ncbi:MAG: anthranilate synthase component I, partial [Leptolyngbya sp. SIO1D8]|nr:anthranilate synthase component I [Leptolyngbya sp. SIO1D8]